MNTAEAQLQAIFGYSSFRPHQKELIQGLLDGQDVFGVMPTGGGKSLCYQLPATLLEGTAVVVSPLIALMKDQVDAANANGIQAAFLNSTQAPDEQREVLQRYRAGELDLLYLAPERLSLSGFLDQLRQTPREKPAFFAIDEAHCLSEWGHDFRPDYLFLSRLKSAFPGVPMAAFTATATRQVAADIEQQLSLQNAVKVRASFDRQNLYYEIRSKTDWRQQMLDFLKARPGQSGIIYRTSRKDVESTANFLQDEGIAAKPYHAGLPLKERSATQEAFLRDDTPVIVATIAFGMGIDKPDVRFVLHGDLPKTIEGYYQETGRAGRDGEPSHCLLLYGPGDAGRLLRFTDEIADETERQRTRDLLRAMDEFARIPSCRRKRLLAYFNENLGKENCGSCDYCDGHFERTDATRDAQIVLSALARSGERFGAVHVCNIVTGANTQKIREFRHTELKTYGVGKDRPKSYWRSLLDSLISQEIVGMSNDQFAVPKLTPAAWKLLKGEATYEIERDTRSEPEKARSRSGSAPDDFPYDEKLFEVLRTLRKTLADEQGVPPFMVASDRTLRALSALVPEDQASFLQVPGMGQKKAEQYAKPILGAIGDYLEENPQARPERNSPAVKKVTRVSKKSASDSTFKETLRLLKSGLNPAKIAAERGLSQSTIEGHLVRLYENGEPINLRDYITEDQINQVATLAEKHGTEALKPIYEASDPQLEYGTIKLALYLLDQS